MSGISLESRVAISEDTVFRELDGEAVILQLDSGMYYGLDPIGTRLWQLMGTHGRLRQVYDAALAEFDVDPAVLERDLLKLVSDLTSRNLLVVQ